MHVQEPRGRDETARVQRLTRPDGPAHLCDPPVAYPHARAHTGGSGPIQDERAFDAEIAGVAGVASVATVASVTGVVHDRSLAGRVHRASGCAQLDAGPWP